MNKLIIIFLILFIFQQSRATDAELSTGGLTYHVISDTSATKLNSNKIDDEGRLIANPTLALGLTTHTEVFFESHNLFIGENSLGKSMGGYLYEEGIEIDNSQFGLTLGAYIQDQRYFDELNINPYKMAEVGTTDLVPIAGVCFNHKWEMSKNLYFKLNNIISPVIINTSVALGYSF